MSKLLILVPTNRFLKDLKKAAKRKKNIEALQNVIDLLQKNQSLPPKYRDHSLKGNWAGYRECHIEPDWLLIYRIEEVNLYLVRNGSHSDLFG